MTKVVADITMSLDGYVTGPGADPLHGLGDADDLHAWVMDPDDVDTDVLEEATARSGAVVMGRRLFDVIDGPGGWSADMGYGAGLAGSPPFFVVTHHPPDDVRLSREVGLRFTFVDDLAAAVDQARGAAGDGDVVIMGGGDVIAQSIDAGLADELHLHIAPMIVGGGTPLFREGIRQSYRHVRVRPSRHAVHVVYERIDAGR
jgi:dihydrofolate reductase